MAVTSDASVTPAVNPVASAEFAVVHAAFAVDSAAFAVVLSEFAVVSAVLGIDPAAIAVVSAAFPLPEVCSHINSRYEPWKKMLLLCLETTKNPKNE